MATIGQVLKAKDLTINEIKRTLRKKNRNLGEKDIQEAVILPGGFDKNGDPTHTITYKQRKQSLPTVSALDHRKAALKEKIQSMRTKESNNK